MHFYCFFHIFALKLYYFRKVIRKKYAAKGLNYPKERLYMHHAKLHGSILNGANVVPVL
jgi:hypothetical protein